MPKPITSPALSELPGIAHGFFTREGGVSKGIYASLNCGVGSKDDAAAVTENRRRVADHLGANCGAVQSVYQVHSAKAVVVENMIAREELPKSDALVTRTPGLAIGVLTADCGPVLFADPKAKVVAAAHAGWRGAVGGILESTVAKMEELGAARRDICAAVGPCINKDAYEVGPDFETDFLKRDNEYARFFHLPEGRTRVHFDLPGFILHRLQLMHLATVTCGAACTNGSESLFFSYRRSNALHHQDYGRQISAIVVA